MIRETEYTPYEVHNQKEIESAKFVGGMLNIIRKNTLKYGDWEYESVSRRYESRSTKSNFFTNLCYLSEYISTNEADQHRSFVNKYCYEFIAGYAHATRDQTLISNHIFDNSVRNGIIDIIWRISDCILFANGKRADELDTAVLRSKQAYDQRVKTPAVHTYDLRDGTMDRRWESDINEWKEMKKSWLKYLAIYDSVFPWVFIDTDATFEKIIDRYPAEFWAMYWQTLSTSSIYQSPFHQYLIYTVGPLLLRNEPYRQNRLCQYAIQHLIDMIERRNAESAIQEFARVTMRQNMMDAFVQTGTQLYPRADLLGAATRQSMSFDREGDGGIRAFYGRRSLQ